MARPPAPARSPTHAAGAVLLAGLLALSLLAGSPDALAYLLPALLLLAVLVGRRYPGERALLALLERREHRRRPPAAVAPLPSRTRALLPRGGQLIASSLAVRPPPASRPALS